MFQSLLLLFVTAFADGSSLTADQLVEKHLQAIGGEAWSKVQSMEITGDYESFSSSAPFTIYRKRPNLYRFDHSMIQMPMVYAFDGERVWWKNPMFGPESAKGEFAPEPHNKPILWEAPFDCALLHWKEKGLQVSAAGMGDFEGRPHHLLKLTYADGLEETWYLDPKTFLKTFMISQTFEYGQPKMMEVFYDDYRKVGEITIPYHVEQEWHTRHRLYTIAEVKLNVELGDDLFKAPPEARATAKEE